MDESKIRGLIEEVKKLILGGRKPQEEDEKLSEIEYARRYSKTNSMAHELWMYTFKKGLSPTLFAI